MTRPVAIVSLLLAGCARTATAPPLDLEPEPEPPPPAEPAAPEPEPAGPEPLVLSAPEMSPAPWALPAAERVIAPRELSGTFEDAADGNGKGLVRWMGGVLVVDAKAGVLGSTALPEGTTWTALDGSDRLYAATSDGTLWRGDAWDAGFGRVGAVPGALDWDATPSTIVAVTREGALRSRDGGERFEPLPALPQRLSAPTILARHDGVVVVQGHAEDGRLQTQVLPRGAPRWREGPSELGPLTRTGAWISDASLYRCGPVLARDGRRWARTRFEDDTVDELTDWSELTELGERVRRMPDGAFVSFTFPAAPRASARCPDEEYGVGGLGMIGTGSGGGEPIRGTTGNLPRATERWARLFGDAACIEDTDGKHRCDQGVPDPHPPHAALWDERERSLRVVPLPSACVRPDSLVSAAGIGLLRCIVPEGEALWTLGPDGTWHDEGTIVAKDLPGELTAATDGTLLLHGTCAHGGSCRSSWLRPPLPLGEGRWIELPPGESLAFRVLDGGRALKISGAAQSGYRISIVDVQGQESTVLEGLAHEQDALTRLEVADDRSLRPFFGSHERMVDAAGELHPPPAEPLGGPWRGTTLALPDAYSTVAAVGDYDGDGRGDIVVVKRRSAEGPAIVRLLRGGSDLAELPPDGLDAAELVSIEVDVPVYIVEEVTGLGDVDGDGYDDLGITLVVPSSGPNTTDGELYVVLGRPTTETRRLSDVRAGKGGFWVGGFPDGQIYAAMIGPAGDLDGDGRGDVALVISAREDHNGRLIVIWGKEGTDWVHLRDVARGRGGFVLEGTPDEPIQGRWAALEDFNGDGRADLAVTTHNEDGARVHLVHGPMGARPSSGLLRDRVASDRSLVITTETERSLVFDAGDLDGDGRSDLAIGQPERDGADVESGRVAIVHGRVGGSRELSLATGAPDDGIGWLLGTFAFDRLGTRIAAIGDLDGDGRSELALGAPGTRRFDEELGRVHVLRGGPRRARISLPDSLDPAAGWTLEVGPGQQRLGQRLCAAGDLDGDGRPDLLMTAGSFTEGPGSPLHLVLDPSAAGE